MMRNNQRTVGILTGFTDSFSLFFLSSPLVNDSDSGQGLSTSAERGAFISPLHFPLPSFFFQILCYRMRVLLWQRVFFFGGVLEIQRYKNREQVAQGHAPHSHSALTGDPVQSLSSEIHTGGLTRLLKFCNRHVDQKRRQQTHALPGNALNKGENMGGGGEIIHYVDYVA